jgi:hypothetical protein
VVSQYEATPRPPARTAALPRERQLATREQLTAAAVARATPIALLVLAAAGGLAWRELGSPNARDWLKYGLLAGLVVAGVLFSKRSIRPSPPALLALAALGGMAILETISISYSAVPTLARDEALLTVFYAAVFAVPALILRTREDRAYAAATIAAGSAGVAVFTAFALVLRAHPETLFYGGRLNFPVSYPNAQAAFVLIGFWPAIAVAARRGLPVWLRAVSVGGATAMLCGWLLTQSKGGALGLLVSAGVVFVVSRRRLRLLVPFALACALAALGALPLTAPLRSQTTVASFRSAIHHGGAVLLWLALAGCVVGLAYAFLDRRLELSSATRQVAGKVALLGTVLVLVAGPAIFFAAVEGPGAFLSRQWHAFKQQPTVETSGTHLLSLGSNRVDFWRVSLGEFAKNPLAGIGSRGFGPAYLQHGRSSETPARAHSLEMDTLAETGLLGAVILVAVLLPPIVAAGRRARDELTSAGVLAGGVYFLVHSSVDWIWTFPAVGVLAFLLLSIGARGPDAAQRPPIVRKASLLGAAAVVLVSLIAFVPPWLASRYEQRALKGGDGVKGDIAWAKRLDPLAIEPYLAEATWSPNLEASVVSLRKAVKLQPRSFAARYLLGINLLKIGRLAEGREQLYAAYKLSPRDPYVQQALKLAPYTRPPR